MTNNLQWTSADSTSLSTQSQARMERQDNRTNSQDDFSLSEGAENINDNGNNTTCKKYKPICDRRLLQYLFYIISITWVLCL